MQVLIFQSIFFRRWSENVNLEAASQRSANEKRGYECSGMRTFPWSHSWKFNSAQDEQPLYPFMTQERLFAIITNGVEREITSCQRNNRMSKPITLPKERKQTHKPHPKRFHKIPWGHVWMSVTSTSA